MTNADPVSTGEDYSGTSLNLPPIRVIVDLADFSVTDENDLWNEVKVQVGWTARRTPDLPQDHEDYRWDIISDGVSIVAPDDLSEGLHKEETFTDVSRVTLYPLAPTIDTDGNNNHLRTHTFHGDNHRVQYRITVKGTHRSGDTEEVLVDNRLFDLDYARSFLPSQSFPWDNVAAESLTALLDSSIVEQPEVLSQQVTDYIDSRTAAVDEAIEAAANAEASAQNAQLSAADSQQQAQQAATTSTEAATAADAAAVSTQAAQTAAQAAQAEVVDLRSTFPMIFGLQHSQILALDPTEHSPGQRWLASNTGDTYENNSDQSSIGKSPELTAGQRIALSLTDGDLSIDVDVSDLEASARPGAFSTSAIPSVGDNPQDWNNWTEPTWFQERLMANAWPNGPGTVAGHSQLSHVQVIKYRPSGGHTGAAGNCIQIAWPYMTTSAAVCPVFIRGRYSNNWTAWFRIDATGIQSQIDALETSTSDLADTAASLQTQIDNIDTGSSGSFSAEAVLAADVTKTSDDTLSTSGELAIASLPVGSYRIDGLLIYESEPTPDFKSLLTLPGGAVTRVAIRGVGPASNDSSPEDSNDQRSPFGVVLETAGSGAGEPLAVEYTGRFEVTTEGTTPTLQWAQANSNVAATTVFAGSYIRVTEA